MKKNFLIIVIIVIAVASIFFFKYKDYQSQKREIDSFNSQYELYNKEKINGLDVITVINKATSNNEKYEIPKDEKGLYILDDQYSIEIYVTLALDEITLNMEKIVSSDITNFVRHFGEIEFKCSNVTYHEKTGRIASMTFEAEEY